MRVLGDYYFFFLGFFFFTPPAATPAAGIAVPDAWPGAGLTPRSASGGGWASDGAARDVVAVSRRF
jgi:hypothetical protein